MNDLYPQIQATSNPIAKSVKALSQKKARREQGLFLAEGVKIIQDALQSGQRPKTVFALESALESNATIQKISRDALSLGASVFSVSAAVIHSVGDAQTPQSLLASFEIPSDPPSGFDEGLFLVLDAVQDPGNLGAMLRNADAMGAAGVLLGEGCADPYGPKCIRSATGSTFHLPIFQTQDLASLIKAMREQQFCLLAADLNGEDDLPDRLPGKTALLIGNEGNGLRPEITELCSLSYRLPMKGRAQSLNAAVCAGILLYICSQRMP